MTEDKEYLEDEIRKEFQLERMVLFSDAVFAIVITLMAIEIRIPDSAEKLTDDMLLHAIHHLYPVILAYFVSFLFVGITWYQHLRVFSYLKDYDKGLVILNLVLLFFIGLFPFGASIFARGEIGATLPLSIYIGNIIICRIIQTILIHYVLFRKPHLCIKTDLSLIKNEFIFSRNGSVGLAVVFALILITRHFIIDPELKPFSTLWILPLVMILKLMKRNRERKLLNS